jgi:hypothetical protein
MQVLGAKSGELPSKQWTLAAEMAWLGQCRIIGKLRFTTMMVRL